MSWLKQLRVNSLGYRVDPDLLNAYRSAIPSTINLDIKREADYFIATVKKIEDESLPPEALLITQAKNEDELVNMVNDLIFTYKNIPEIYRPYYRQILRPEGSLAKSNSLKLAKAS